LPAKRLVALDIHDVVGDLEREPDIARIAAQRRAAVGRDASEDRAGFDRKGDQRARS
jgi:hypothetical protein